MQLQIDVAYSLVIVLPSNVPSVKTVTYALRHKMCESRKKCVLHSPLWTLLHNPYPFLSPNYF